MFYITAHKVTENQFSNEANNANELANNRKSSVPCPACIDIPPSANNHYPVRVNTGLARAPIILRPNDLNSLQKDRKKSQELHEVIIANGLR